MLYLVGEPLIQARSPKERFQAPIGQAGLCLQVLQEAGNAREIKTKLQLEYLAIILALQQMGIEFRIIHAHPSQLDPEILAVCVEKLGCRLAGFTEDFFPPSVAYPRDFSSVLGGLVLINEGTQVLAVEKNGYRMVNSPYGEGGSILHSLNTAIICERVCKQYGEDGFRRYEESDLSPLREAGIKIGPFPAIVGEAIINQRHTDRVFSNNHIDRVAGLLAGRDGRLHLIVDPAIVGTDWDGALKPWTPIFAADLVPQLQRRYESLGVVVHAPSKLSVPYSLNFMSFPDGRVLMTSGDPEAEALVCSIAGKENVYTTQVPIRYYPTFHYAGIRCLIGDFPEPLFKRAG